MANIFFILGYFALHLINVNALLSPLEKLVLSFYLSIFVNSVLYAFTLIYPEDWRVLIINITYITLALFVYIKQGKSGSKLLTINKNFISFSFLDGLVLSIITFLFILSIVTTYPQMVTRLGLDIVRHYSASSMINKDVTNYVSPYPCLHIQIASLNLLSNMPMETTQTALALLSIMSIISFYVMSKAYLTDLNPKLPILSTIFWSLFSGMGGIFFNIKDAGCRYP